MKIVVIGGTGLIGKKLVGILQQGGHEVVVASPRSGVNAVTGEGLAGALAGADVVVDVANSPNWEDNAVMEFFDKSGRNLRAAEVAAGVKHHVALSVVGSHRLTQSGYFRAKIAQEELIKSSEIPYTIVRATQFMEFVASIAQSGIDGDTVRMADAFIQPIAADDVAALMADYAVGPPLNATVDIAGPDRVRIADLAERHFKAMNDPRKVVADVKTGYFGTPLEEDTLTPVGQARLGPTSYEDWLSSQKVSA